MTIERMLTEVFGLEWYKVHDEAEQLEHAVSTDFEQKLIEKLGANGVCPHGNVVGADSPAARRERGLHCASGSVELRWACRPFADDLFCPTGCPSPTGCLATRDVWGDVRRTLGKRPACARSSTGQSNGLRNHRLGVRVPPGVIGFV